MDHPATASDRPIGYWLKLVDRLIEDRFDALLSTEGLSRRHWQVLNLLAAGPAPLARIDAQVAPFLESGRASTAPMLDELRARGWVEESRGGHALTAAGERAHALLLRAVADLRRRVAAGIRPAEYEATVDVLRRMAANLGWHERSP